MNELRDIATWTASAVEGAVQVPGPTLETLRARLAPHQRYSDVHLWRGGTTENLLFSPPQVSDQVPLTQQENGVLYVAETRVPLDSLLVAFLHGETPEEIAMAFPSLDLPDVYLVLAHYLKHRSDYDAYLAARSAAVGSLRHTIESALSPEGVRSRLIP